MSCPQRVPGSAQNDDGAIAWVCRPLAPVVLSGATLVDHHASRFQMHFTCIEISNGQEYLEL